MSIATRTSWFRTLVAGLLVCSIVGLSGTAVRADDDDAAEFKKLDSQLRKAHAKGDYEKALEIAEKMIEIEPDHLGTLYNTACLHCLLGHRDKAYKSLERAIEAGWTDAEHIYKDDDFKTIRSEDRFRAIVKKLRSAKGSKQKDAEPKKKQEKEKAVPKKPDKPEKPDKPKKPDIADLSAREHGQKVGELTRGLVEAAQAGNVKKALKIALEALGHAEALEKKQAGERATRALSLTNYNVACMYSLSGKKDAAFKHLERTVEIGSFPGDSGLVEQMEGDSDLDNIRDDPRYAKALKGAKGRAAGVDPSEGEVVEPKWKVTLPKRYKESKKAPLLIALHPYGGNMEATTKRWAKAAGRVGAILLTPQGTIKLDDESYHWGRNLDTIEANVLDAINDVMDEHNVDQDKVILAGFSQGGWATWALALRYPDTFRGIIPVAGNFEAPSESYFEDEDLAKLRIYIMIGEDEKEALLDANKKAAKRFKKLGARVKLNIYDGVAHAFPDNATREQVKALRFVLGG